MADVRNIYVYKDWDTSIPEKIGTIYVEGGKGKETRRYLATIPGRFEFVFTPKHGSWLNMVTHCLHREK